MLLVALIDNVVDKVLSIKAKQKYLAIAIVANSLKSPHTAEICSFLVILPQKGGKHTWYIKEHKILLNQALE